MSRAPHDPAILFDRVTKLFRRGRRTAGALETLTLAVEAGGIAALVGPNGSGKTTALRIAATLVTPSSGTCIVLGLDVLHRPRDVRRSIGVSLGSERSFYLRLTARQNLGFFAGILGMSASETRGAIRR